MRVAVFDLLDAISIFYTLSKISELYIYDILLCVRMYNIHSIFNCTKNC